MFSGWCLNQNFSFLNFYFYDFCQFFLQKIFSKLKNTPLPYNVISIISFLTYILENEYFFYFYIKIKYLIFYDFLKGWLILSLPLYLMLRSFLFINLFVLF